MRRRARAVMCVVAVAVLAAAAPAPAATGPEPDRSDHRASPPGGGPRNEPSVAVHPRDPRIVASASHEDLGRPTITVNLSRDGGATWGDRSLMPTVQGAPLPSDPHVAFDAAGRLHAAYLSYDVDDSGRLDFAVGGLVVARSADGRDWPATPTYVARNRKAAAGCAFADFPALATDPRPAHRDTVYVAWRSIEYADRECSTGLRSPVYLARSTDGGRTWSRPVRMPVSDEQLPYIPTLTVGPTGAVHVTYATVVAGGSPRCGAIAAIDVHVATSTDGGRTLRDSVAMSGVCIPGFVRAALGVQLILSSATGSTWRLPASTNTAVDPRSRRLVTVVGAQDPTTRQTTVQVAVSDDGGGAWRAGAAPRLSATDNAQFPRIAAGPHGVALLFLAQRPGGIFVAQGTSSRDGARTWAPTLTLSTAPSVLRHPHGFNFIGDYLGLAVGRDGLAHPVWTDLREFGTGQHQAIYTRSFAT